MTSSPARGIFREAVAGKGKLPRRLAGGDLVDEALVDSADPLLRHVGREWRGGGHVFMARAVVSSLRIYRRHFWSQREKGLTRLGS